MPDPNLRGFQEQNNRLKMNRDMCKHALVSKVNSTRTVNVRANTEQRVRERENMMKLDKSQKSGRGRTIWDKN